MQTDHECLVCGRERAEVQQKVGDFSEIVCQSCGHYRITDTAAAAMHALQPAERFAHLQAAIMEAKLKQLDVPTIGAT
jgi:transcription elongation factor Elf1